MAEAGEKQRLGRAEVPPFLALPLLFLPAGLLSPLPLDPRPLAPARALRSTSEAGPQLALRASKWWVDRPFRVTRDVRAHLRTLQARRPG